ncbi:hypothetical protein PRNP1_004854 [Phytophthora ramorum]
MVPRRRKWLPLALFFVGVVYGCLLLRWYNARLASTSQSSVSRTFRPKFGEQEVVPSSRKPLPARKKQLPRLILSPQGRAAIRREQLAKVPEPVNGRETPTETEDPKLVAARLARDKQQEAEAHAETLSPFFMIKSPPAVAGKRICFSISHDIPARFPEISVVFATMADAIVCA